MAGKLIHILIGWGKKLRILQTSTAEKKLSDLRLSICGPCDNSKEAKLLELINGKMKNEDKLVCKICHCPCLEKTLVVEESCPIEKW